MYDYNVINNFDEIINILNHLKLIATYSLIQSNVRLQVAIIIYHHIGNKKDDYLLNRINTSDFEKQMRYLQETHEIITFEKLTQAITEKKSLPKRAAIITFDDGYKDNYTEAFPILKKYKIPATIFLTTGHIETNEIFWWNKIGYILCNTKLKKIELEDLGDISPPSIENISYSLRMIYQKFKKIPEDKKNKLINLLIQKSDIKIPKGLNKDLMMSWDNIREMNENGIDFGAHTVTHPILTNLSLDQAKLEIVESKKIIEKRLNKTITTFCYPNGFANDYNSDIIKILKDNGFICSVTAIPKMVTMKSDLFELGRLPPGYDYKSFKFCISGLYSVLNKMLG
ncbi:MAG: polysaccharide deacetylase family protein [Candidatus Thermoplasmatota archaeon]|nr:polysaccharide deacetylase family protein [Candidatus Thermoplasmatota archaeon]